MTGEAALDRQRLISDSRKSLVFSMVLRGLKYNIANNHLSYSVLLLEHFYK